MTELLKHYDKKVKERRGGQFFRISVVNSISKKKVYLRTMWGRSKKEILVHALNVYSHKLENGLIKRRLVVESLA